MPNARVTQAALEVILRSGGEVRVTQSALEVILRSGGEARVTQSALEVLVRMNVDRYVEVGDSAHTTTSKKTGFDFLKHLNPNEDIAVNGWKRG